MTVRPADFLFPIVVILLLSGCGGGTGVAVSFSGPGDPDPDSDERSGGLLIVISSEQELVDSVRAGFDNELTRNRLTIRNGEESTSDVAFDSPGSGRFSTTYTQEANVDEHDIVKYDGDHLFIAPSRGVTCCFILEDAGVDEQFAPIPDSGPRSIRVLSTDSESATARESARIALDDGQTIEGLYVHGSQLVAISSSSWWGTYGTRFAKPENWSGQLAGLQLFDVSDASNPTLSWEFIVEGGFVNSRKLGNTVYLITRYTPSLERLVYYPTDDLQESDNRQVLDSLGIDDIIPRVRVNGVESALFEAQDCYVTDSEHEFASNETGYPTLTTIIAIDLTDPDAFRSVCYAEAASGTYVSPNAIYLTQVDYRDAIVPRTLIHRFILAAQPVYDGSARIDGNLRTDGNLDFRVSEFDNRLRLVTTVWNNDETDRFDHHLTILQPSTTALALETVATLPNEDNPEPIGKPNEDLYGVRFLGDRAYLVTFERIDPLYVIDLSDPVNPEIAGELEIPGFSDFLHPVNDSLLLGLGQDEKGLVKLELFDVSDITDPSSLGSVVLFDGAQWSHSEARYNRHAFTYLPDVDGVDRFSVPVNAGLMDEDGALRTEDRLYLFEIRDKNDPQNASIAQAGFITALPKPVNYYGGQQNRAVFDDDAVFYVDGGQVWSALWTNPFNQTGPQ